MILLVVLVEIDKTVIVIFTIFYICIYETSNSKKKLKTKKKTLYY